MVSYIIVTRNPTSQRLMVIQEGAQFPDGTDDTVIAEFATEDEAYDRAETLPICRAWGAEIVPLGGLGVV